MPLRGLAQLFHSLEGIIATYGVPVDMAALDIVCHVGPNLGRAFGPTSIKISLLSRQSWKTRRSDPA
jgi:hypothetical protein